MAELDRQDSVFVTTALIERRLRNERLLGSTLTDPSEVVEWLGAVQAQDFAGAKWALSLRTTDCSDDDIERAFSAGEILRLHLLRPTWHFVAPAHVRSLLRLTSANVHKQNAYPYRLFELDAAVLRKSRKVLARALRERAQPTRDELARALERAGIGGASGPRLAYILMHAELEGMLCSGARRGKQHTYALLDERGPHGAALPREEALAWLTERYFASHGPALALDFAWWSGLSMADVKAGLSLSGERLIADKHGDKTYWSAAEVAAPTPRRKSPSVHLLPNYDEYLVAFKDRSLSYTPADFAARGARLLAAHYILIDGRLVGGWRREPVKGGIELQATTIARLTRAQRTALDREVERYARFLGTSVNLTLTH